MLDRLSRCAYIAEYPVILNFLDLELKPTVQAVEDIATSCSQLFFSCAVIMRSTSAKSRKRSCYKTCFGRHCRTYSAQSLQHLQILLELNG